MDVFDDFCTAQSEQPTPMTFATAVHLIRGSVSLLLAVLLIALKQNPAGVRRYRDARRCIIGTAMVNVVVDCLSAAADFSGNRISHLIDGTIVPLAYIAQAILLGVAVSIMLKDGKTANAPLCGFLCRFLGALRRLRTDTGRGCLAGPPPAQDRNPRRLHNHISQ